MPTFGKIEAKPTFRDWQGRFTKAADSVIQGRQEAVKVLGKKYVEAARAEAPGKNFPKTIGYQTFTVSNGVGFRAYAEEPLFTFITKGTKPHIIRGNPILAFHWERGPEGPGMYFYRYVNHPGTKPNPFHERAWDKVEGDIMPEMRKISLRMINTIKGK